MSLIGPNDSAHGILTMKIPKIITRTDFIRFVLSFFVMFETLISTRLMDDVIVAKKTVIRKSNRILSQMVAD